MYIRNIVELFEDLKENEKLVLFFKSGNRTNLLKSDVISVTSADLKVIRALHFDGRNVMLIDPAEIEKCLICKVGL